MGVPSQGHMGTFVNYFGTVNGLTHMMTVYDGSVVCGEVAKAYYESIGKTLDYISREN